MSRTQIDGGSFQQNMTIPANSSAVMKSGLPSALQYSSKEIPIVLWMLVLIYPGSGAKYATTTDYVFNGDTLVSTIDQQLASGVATGTAQTRYTHPDHLGSTNVVTDASGTVVQTLDYYPYGGTRISGGSNVESRQYIGQFSDQNTNLDYFNAHYYDSSHGQFLSEDPVFLGDPKQQALTDPQSLNAYSYSEDNPITKSDPLGKRVELVSRPIGDYYWIPLSDFGAHTFVNVTPDDPSIIGSINGVNTSVPFTLSGIPAGGFGSAIQKKANDPTDYFYASCGTLCPAGASVTVAPPNGVSPSQFDRNVVASYNSLPGDLGPYDPFSAPRIAGMPNSNNAATAILTGAGVGQNQIYQYRSTLQNVNNRWSPGLGVSATTPTYYQQTLSLLSSAVTAIGNYLSGLSSSGQSSSKTH
jgi:RHS repeat-associated protein